MPVKAEIRAGILFPAKTEIGKMVIAARAQYPGKKTADNQHGGQKRGEKRPDRAAIVKEKPEKQGGKNQAGGIPPEKTQD